MTSSVLSMRGCDDLLGYRVPCCTHQHVARWRTLLKSCSIRGCLGREDAGVQEEDLAPGRLCSMPTFPRPSADKWLMCAYLPRALFIKTYDSSAEVKTTTAVKQELLNSKVVCFFTSIPYTMIEKVFVWTDCPGDRWTDINIILEKEFIWQSHFQ